MCVLGSGNITVMLLGILGCGGFQLWIFHLFVGLNVSAIPKTWVFPGGSDGKESACNGRGPGFDLWVGKVLGGQNVNALQYSCLENPHGQRSLAGDSPWGHREIHMTEQVVPKPRRRP